MRREFKPIEKNPLKRAWIYFWYFDMSRLFLITGIHLMPTLLFFEYLNTLGIIEGITIRKILIIQYCLIFGWAMLDNDYTELERIGLNPYRERLDTQSK